MKVLWLSRHSATGSQIDDLKRIFGEVEIVEVSQTVNSGREVTDLMQSNDCNEAVVVLPPNLLEQIIRGGYKPLRAVMERELQEDGSAVFTHSHFERVNEVKIITERL